MNEIQLRTFKPDLVPHPKLKNDPNFTLNSARMSGTPIDLEIGCGVGYHAIQYARQNPNRVLVAIERTQNKYSAFQSRLDHHAPIQNLIPLHTHAVSWVTHEARAHDFSKIFFYYPNPSPKSPSKRWIQMPFFGFLIKTLIPHGSIHFATNEPFYFNELLTVGVKRWGLTIESLNEISKTNYPDFIPRTHFEKKYFLRGDTCFDLVFRKLL